MANEVLKILIYASDGEQRKKLLSAINPYSSQFTLVTLGDFDDLDIRLRHEATGEMWLVLVTGNLVELGRLTGMRELIRNNKSILVLPDQTPETVSMGHTLYPRFISYLDSDYNDIGSVLGEVIRKNKAKDEHIHY